MNIQEDANDYDWAQGVFDLANSSDSDLPALAKMANLNPIAGDLSHIDLSNMSIEGQNLSNWNLEHANFRNCKIGNTNLKNARISTEQLLQARGWRKAVVDDDLRERTLLTEAEKTLRMPFVQYLGKLIGVAMGQDRTDDREFGGKIYDGLLRNNDSTVEEFLIQLTNARVRGGLLGARMADLRSAFRLWEIMYEDFVDLSHVKNRDMAKMFHVSARAVLAKLMQGEMKRKASMRRRSTRKKVLKIVD